MNVQWPFTIELVGGIASDVVLICHRNVCGGAVEGGGGAHVLNCHPRLCP
jgi:hypothetical protein